ncbi:TIR domain-containing protein [Winogradskyella sp.]|jgi:hypothetical protein|uniref:TIR domain-containing protein n=1 Tax=Winogradskyella sp. TaxID=1883156 RepID=UPI0025CEEABE|nr:TIR domain-containing protein [Winogradskyella sp.]MCT4628817.1 TIR domain-containing protein [Winogradskyella sp.]
MNRIIKYIAGGLIINEALNYLFKNNTSKQRRIFISHSWKKGSDDYLSLKKKLNKYKIKVYDHSIPEFKAFNEKKQEKLEKIFRNQMFYCSKILVLGNSGLEENSFVMTEIKIAKELKKEIVAIKPYGQYSIPQFIRRNSSKVIGNNINSIKEILK